LFQKHVEMDPPPKFRYILLLTPSKDLVFRGGQLLAFKYRKFSLYPVSLHLILRDGDHVVPEVLQLPEI